MAVSRIACLYVPDLPLQALLRAEPELCGRPVAVIEGTGPRARVLCAAAEASGVVQGMPPARARALCPEVLLRSVAEEMTRSCMDAVFELALAFSPRCERAVRSVQLEVGDLHHLFATEEDIAAALLHQAAAQGMRVHVAIARSSLTAQVLAFACPGVCIVPSGKEQARLQRLPILTLPLSDMQAATLTRWGLRTVGDLAALPRERLSSRLGRAGVSLHRLACGEDDSPLCPSPAPEQISEAVDLEDGIDSLEPLWFLLRGLVGRMVARLSLRSLSAQGYELRLSLWPQGVLVRAFELAVPTREVAALVDLARVALSAQPPTGPVRRVEVIARPAVGRPTQLSLLEPAGPRPEALATTLARLEILCGKGRIGAPSVLDSYLPGQASLVSFSGAYVRQPPLPARGGDSLTAHLLRPARPTEVTTERGTPVSLIVDHAPRRILQVGGPFRLRVGLGAPVLRDYYDVELEGGGLYRIYQDLASDLWSIDARYV